MASTRLILSATGLHSRTHAHTRTHAVKHTHTHTHTQGGPAASSDPDPLRWHIPCGVSICVWWWWHPWYHVVLLSGVHPGLHCSVPSGPQQTPTRPVAPTVHTCIHTPIQTRAYPHKCTHTTHAHTCPHNLIHARTQNLPVGERRQPCLQKLPEQRFPQFPQVKQVIRDS